MAIEEINDQSFAAKTKTGLVLVDFFADWCGPCRMLTPILKEFSEEMKGKLTICKIDVDASQNVAAQFQITSIPTLILFKDGKEVVRKLGLMDKKTLLGFIQPYLS